MTQIEIYYTKSVFLTINNKLANFDINEVIEDIIKHLPVTHIKVYEQTLSSSTTPSTKMNWNQILEYYFELFNNENNPLATDDKQALLIKYKSHTSMSVGDIIKFNDEYHYCKGMGWKLLSQ
ncbi:hypothetical protein LCGC14_0195740 [marine sediment metagenome]|uniref:Uncharacterized protein n=1 Tax=marine sediment metagenome TaxID=412755 RepID=A0A0F9X4G6_9ZZZZ